VDNLVVHIDRRGIVRDDLHEHPDGAVDSCAVSARVCSIDREAHRLSFVFFFQAFAGFGDLFAEQFWCLDWVLVDLDIVAEGDCWPLFASALTQTRLDRDIVPITIKFPICLETSDDVFAIAVATAVACTDSDGEEWHGEVIGNR
jgi:hypothetical protein